MGMITIAKDRDGCRDLMEKGMAFVVRLNRRNDGGVGGRDGDARAILRLKERVEQM